MFFNFKKAKMIFFFKIKKMKAILLSGFSKNSKSVEKKKEKKMKF
jgi:hypothetical protein